MFPLISSDCLVLVVSGYLDYWLNSIHTHAVARDPSQQTLTQPPVIIVCTHKDTLEKVPPKDATFL